MNFRIKRHMFIPTRARSLRWIRNALITIGIVLLSYTALVLLDRKMYQDDEGWRFERALKASTATVESSDQDQAFPVPPLAVPESMRNESLTIANRNDAPLGRIEISRIGLRAMIMEGIDEPTLRRAVGHIPGTALPGQKGNIGIAGHRDTLFRALRNIRLQDEIALTTSQGSYRYQVNATKIVDPAEVQVLDNPNSEVLTLITCYPFSFIGSAPRRFVVRAYRIAD